MMEHIKKLVVTMRFDENELEVGELVSDSRNIYFRYYPDFVKQGLEISPIKLNLNSAVNKADEVPFDGLFGVFADSLPDGWGRLLLDRALAAKGVSVSHITPLDRLAFVGTNGMGALMFRPELSVESAESIKIELDEIAHATQQVIAGYANEVLDELYRLGGSSGGARPKVLVGYNPMTGHLVGNEKILPPNYEHWLIKFPSHADRSDIANVEIAYHKMALDAGLEMSESKLFEGKSGKAYFGTKRFDRKGNDRLHLHSAAGMMHDNFRLSNMDYGHLMDCAFRLENSIHAYEKILRLAAFNVFAHNRDDHSKNCSFLMDAQGNWKLAPAYDLTFSYSGHGMHSMMIAGESANPTKEHLMKLANYFKVKNASALIDEVRGVVNNWKRYASVADVGRVSKSEIFNAINK
jgi:serine/threonine-protein kinase HipA